MSTSPEVLSTLDVALRVAKALESIGCSYFIGGSVAKVDLFALGPGRYDEVEFTRRRKVRVRSTGEELFIKAPEDTVLRKLLWYRQGGEVSDKQWRDVVEVLRISAAQLDAQYLQQWARELCIQDLLLRAQQEAR